MRYVRTVVLLLGLIASVVTAGQVPSTGNQNTPAGDAAKGKAAFTRAACVACHGDQGQGSNLAPRLAASGFDFAMMLNYVRQPGGTMPPVSGDVASDQDLADIYAYLRSLPTNQVSVLTGDPQKGKQLFANDGCYECHGTQGQGGTAGARIGPPPISQSTFTQYAHHPRGQMPPYTDKVASDQDLADVYAYLKSLPSPQHSREIPLLEH